MAYTITQHTKNRAKEHGVKVKPSSKKHKKIDVIKGGEIIASVGDKRYPDYGVLLQKEDRGQVKAGTANERRRAYHARHGRYAKGTRGYWASELLW